ncbi:ABC transporter ATP-binding protein [Microcoleus sp. FACHB-831]|uniref:ABC transporter ATP-binding protein n=1 Tax=Microcoleus sp. FACHB-831 TaxID=2692827 RepID=UPI0016873978|nr:ABC transporter ATP-binding protein [Microcoleus sp. FACHB-831]MBD1920777.1 ABC transporter ATP-binding protein [Microcoleus sp. FACHB-831]
MTSMRDRVQGVVQGRVLEKVATFEDIALFETPSLLNLVQLAEKGVERLKELAVRIGIALSGIFVFLPALALSASIAWWVPLVMFITAAPSIYVQINYNNRSWSIETSQASSVREMNLYARVLTSEDYAKELRLFGLQGLWLERWQSLFWQIFSEMQQVRRRGTWVVFAWSLLSGLGAALPYIYVVMGALRGSYTLGDLALYAGLIIQVRQSLFILIGNSADLYELALSVRPIFQLLELEPQLRLMLLSGRRTGGNVAPIGIEIDNLSFYYPGSDRLTLDNINLTIQPGEMVALVGENGAGKTTLAKLLCRLYDPNSGSIEWNGRDMRSLDLDRLRSRIAVVMQDYARFPATVRENVGFGYLSDLHDNDTIMRAISRAGIASKIESLPQGLETPLGKQLEGGVDLSGGQWQRIAIARSLMRLSHAELLVFDEPTASLDPKTEQEIYNIFRTIARGRMTVVVSHRLALAKIADRVVVMENGKLVETGTHDELMKLGDRYYSMFTRQASSYL